MQNLNEQLKGISESFAFIVPELVIAVAMLLLIIFGLFSNRRNAVLSIITMVAAGTSFILIILDGFQTSQPVFNNMMQRDGPGQFLMLIVDASVVLTCLMSLQQGPSRNPSEYFALILSIALGCHLLLMSNNLIMIFLGLELISISSYVLAGYSYTKAGTEGSLKFFLFGSVASAIMLYGFTLLYGLTGTMDITSRQFFDGLAGSGSPLLLIAGLMGLCGFLFKMAAVPMQLWAPDVYEAAPMPVIAYFSVAPKVAGIGILAKFTLSMNLFGQGRFDWQIIIAVVALLTITVGNFSALWQKDAKRMMAYSSIAQSGFLLVGVAAFLPEGIQFMLFYAAVYLLMNFAVFSFLLYFENRGLSSMESFSGTGRRYILGAIGLTIAFVALTGLPPTGGFTAKLFIFSSLWQAYTETHKMLLIWLLVFGLVNTVVSLFYYLRIPYFAYIRSGDGPGGQKKRETENLLGLVLVVMVVVIFFVPGLLMGLINRINFVP